MDTDLVKKTFLRAFERRNHPDGLTFHSDQGAQYTAFEFRKMLREFGVRQSLSNPGTPHDNAVAEAFFSILKREALSHNWYTSAERPEGLLRPGLIGRVSKVLTIAHSPPLWNTSNAYLLS